MDSKSDREVVVEHKGCADAQQWTKFMEHWGFSLAALFLFIISRIFVFFLNLNGLPWICFFTASFASLIFGAVLIVYAKLPVYRSGQYFAFGAKSIPASLIGHYRWGWRAFSFGVVLSLCLLLSRQ